MIEIKHLVKRFGPFTAVDGVSFNVQRGEVLGFLGPNGAGKSTTMKNGHGLLTPSEGTAIVAGYDVSKDPLRVKQSIGYLPEAPPAYADMTPETFLNFCAASAACGALKRKRVDEVVAMVHLEGVMRQTIDTLSKGFKRVGLAQAILHDPDVLIMDEPTDGLDPNQKHEVRALIKNMASSKAVLLSTHILEEVEAVCTRAVIINRGKIIADGTPAQLQSKSRFHNAVTVTLKQTPGGTEAIKSEIGRVSGVAEVIVETTGGKIAFTAIAKGGRSILDEVRQHVRSKGWDVDEIRTESGRLDDVFRAMTAGQGAKA